MADKAENGSQQLLTFRLCGDTYAVNVVQVREILDTIEVTAVPQTPDYMLGVINLRGSVVPVIDLRHRFGMQVGQRDRDNCIIVMELCMDGVLTVIGALADAVDEVLVISDDNIEPPPRLGNQLDVRFIRGLGKNGDDFFMILDIDLIFNQDEVQMLGEVNTESLEEAC